MFRRPFALESFCTHIFLYSGKDIELCILLLDNAIKMRGEVKFAITNETKNFLFFAIFNSNAGPQEVFYGGELCVNVGHHG